MKRLKTVYNAIITLGDTDDSGKGRHFKSRFIQPGLVKIEGHGVVLIKKETLDESLKSMVGSPFIVLHKTITEDNADELRDGVCSTAYYNEADGWYYTEGIIWDKTAQNLITDKGWSVSCSYDVLEINDEGGVENNIPYDKEFTKLNFTHLALVNNPRYERANIVFNAKDFITVGEGESKHAIPIEYLMPNIEDYENPTADYKLPNIPIELLEKLNKQQKPLLLKKNIIEKNKNNHPDIDIKDYNDILSKGIYKADVAFKTKTNDDYYNFVHYGEKYHPQILIELSETKDNYEIVNFYRVDDKKLDKKLKKAIKRVDNEGGQFLIDIEDNSSKVGVLSNLEIDSIDSIIHFSEISTPYGENVKENEDMKINNGWITKYDKDGEPYHVNIDDTRNMEDKKNNDFDIKKHLEERRKNAKNFSEITSGYLDNLKTNNKTTYKEVMHLVKKYFTTVKHLDKKGLLSKKEEVDRIPDYLNSDLKYTPEGEKLREFARKQGKTYGYLIKTIYELNHRIKNNKEQDMALLEEIKKLISRVENNKENEPMTLKDKIISILNSNDVDVDTIEEIEKTLIEAEKRIDNEKEKEPEEEKQPEDEKVENSEEEQKEEKPTEEKKEPEKEEKEQEKVDNAKPDYFEKLNAIYNSANEVKQTTEFKTRQERLEDGKRF